MPKVSLLHFVCCHDFLFIKVSLHVLRIHFAKALKSNTENSNLFGVTPVKRWSPLPKAPSDALGPPKSHPWITSISDIPAFQRDETDFIVWPAIVHIVLYAYIGFSINNASSLTVTIVTVIIPVCAPGTRFSCLAYTVPSFQQTRRLWHTQVWLKVQSCSEPDCKVCTANLSMISLLGKSLLCWFEFCAIWSDHTSLSST